MSKWLSLAIIILLVLIFVGLLGRIIRRLARRYGPSPWIPPFRAQNLAKPIVDYMFANMYCGNYDDWGKGGNYGPLWSRTTPTRVNPDGSGIRSCPDEVDFWESGYYMEIIANYSSFTGDQEYDFLFLAGLAPSLNTQLMTRSNGVWNDDALWFALAFARMFEVTGNYRFIISANAIFDYILDTAFSPDVCEGENITTSWWVVNMREPTGVGGYRNNVTVSQTLNMAGRFYDLYPQFPRGDADIPAPENYWWPVKPRDYYWWVMKQQIEALMRMVSSTGLLTDGGLECGGKPPDSYGATYGQGVCMEGFIRASRIAFERGEVTFGKKVLAFILDLIDLMTLPASQNIRIQLPSSGCSVRVADMVDAGAGTKEACSAAGGCWDDRLPSGVHPFCYKPVDYTYRNPLLSNVTTPSGQAITILTENAGVGAFGCSGNTDFQAFKGLCVRFMGYALYMMERDLLPNWSSELPANFRPVLRQGKQFLYNNLQWAYSNAHIDGTGRYSTAWEIPHDQNQNMCPYNTGSITTFTMVELINACSLLGVTPSDLEPIPQTGTPFVPPGTQNP